MSLPVVTFPWEFMMKITFFSPRPNALSTAIWLPPPLTAGGGLATLVCPTFFSPLTSG
jgi:hypothetical protein